MEKLSAEKRNALLEDFRSARREQRKLSAALDILIHLDEFSADDAAVILDYLAFRKRSAVLELIRLGSISGIRAMGRLSLIEEKNLEEYRSAANECGELEIWAYLYRYEADEAARVPEAERSLQTAGRPAEAEPVEPGLKEAEPGPENGRKTEEKQKTTAVRELLAEKVFSHITRNLTRMLPGFGPVLESMDVHAEAEGDYLSCDGFAICFDAEKLLSSYLEDSAFTERNVLHMLFHNMFFHPLLQTGHDVRLWNLACDIFTELTLDGWDLKNLSKKQEDFRLVALKEYSLPMEYQNAEAAYQALSAASLPEAFLKRLENEFTVDSHRSWSSFRTPELLRRDRAFADTSQKLNPAFSVHSPLRPGDDGDGNGDEEKTKKALAFAKKWGKIRNELGISFGQEGRQHGLTPGSGEQEVTLIRKHEYSYRDFLSDFMVCQEELELDLDSFDYLPYTYSREHYDGMVILEPLEYKEMYKLDEMVIAIDTSGSCRGEIVRKFLEETWNILTEKGNFFRKMTVHIIQCDSMIQEHVVIRSREEFEDYMDNVKVLGLGGTDFRPVFDLVDELIRKKELQNLKGLLYFTDGDGIYPTKMPAYDVAFIFLNKQTEKRQPPNWAIRLNLGLEIPGIEEY